VGTTATVGLIVDPAVAQDEPKKVLVGQLSGAKTTSARGWIVEGLQNDPRFEVVGSEEGDELKTGASEADVAEAAMGLEADAVVLGLSRFGKGWSAELHIHDGKDGHLIEKVSVKGGSFSAYEEGLTSGADYFAVVEQAEGFPPPVVEEPILEEEVEEEVEVEVEPEADTGAPSPLDVTVGGRVYSRAFRYTDTIEQLGGTASPLIDYNLDAAPMPLAALHWYPGAHFTDGVGSHIGITAGYEMGIATQVRYIDPAGTESSFSQSHSLWYAGLRGRIPISMVTLGLGANYGGHSFSLKDDSGEAPAGVCADGEPCPLFPNVNYSFLELGGDAEFHVGDLFLGAQAAYLLVLNSGDISSDEWFPNAKASGLHLGAYAGWGLSPAFDLLGGIDTRLYGFNFNPVDTARPDERVAGGATDKFISAWLGLRIKIPEKSGEGAAAADSDDGGGGDDFDSFD
jgi:hypothetical protein